MPSKVRNRHVLKSKDCKKLLSQLRASFPVSVNLDVLEKGMVEDVEVLIADGKVFAFWVGDEILPSLRSLLVSPPDTKYVTVDMGAVKFLLNGADIMAPGIVDADPSVAEGELVWVRDERNLRPLAVGRALMSGEKMKNQNTGKAVLNIHYYGDGLWNIGV